jgi:hypothetical protein
MLEPPIKGFWCFKRVLNLLCNSYIEAEFYGNQLPHIDRRVFVTYYLRQTVRQMSVLFRTLFPDAIAGQIP